MMSIVDVIVEIGSFIATIGTFLINLVESTITAVGVVVSASVVPFTISPLVPAIIGTSVGIVAAISIVKLIVGWGNN